MKRRVTFLTNSAGYGGTEKHLLELLRRLDPEAFGARVGCFGQNPYSSRLADYGLNGTVPVLTFPRGRRTVVGYSRLLSSPPSDSVVFVNGAQNLFRWHAYAAAKLARGRRVVAIEHSVAQPIRDRLPQRLKAGHSVVARGLRFVAAQKMKLPGRLADLTICVSDGVRRVLEKEYGYPKSKTITIPNGVDPELFKPDEVVRNVVRSRLGIGKNEKVVLVVARLSEVKGIDVLLNALSLLPPDKYSKCLIVGDGPLSDELRATSADLGLSNRAVFVGHADDPIPYYQSADLFVLPSYLEGLPYSLLEASSCGLPCVATRIPGNDEVVTDGWNGRLFDPGDHRQLADQIGSVLGDREAAARMGQEGRQRVLERFHLGRSMRRIAEFL